MDRQKYYVSLQSRTIMAQRGDAAYELEIEATSDELNLLKELFDGMEDFDEASFRRNMIPGVPYHHDSENDGYDYYLKEAYKLVHQLGTEETRQFVASMNLQLGAEHE